MTGIANVTKLKWEQRQRLALLETTVFWSGEISTGTLIKRFNISRVQASKDFTLYQSLCPGNIRYDLHMKRYVPSETFIPAFTAATPDEFLQLLKTSQYKDFHAVVTLADNLPITGIAEPTFRQVDPNILRSINQAIVSDKEIRINYRSSTTATPEDHRLCPHALLFDGLSWRVRAFSYAYHDFHDFALTRILSAALGPDAEIDSSEDTDWNNSATVRIGAHPGLTDIQRAEIEFDYAMKDGVLECTMRAAIAPYFLKTMGIDADDIKRDPDVQRIVLLNRKELNQQIAS